MVARTTSGGEILALVSFAKKCSRHQDPTIRLEKGGLAAAHFQPA